MTTTILKAGALLAWALSLLLLQPDTARGQVLYCPNDPAAPYGNCVCASAFPGTFICARLANGGCSCQSAAAFIACSGENFCTPQNYGLSPEAKEKVKAASDLFAATAAATVIIAQGAGPAAPWINAAATVQGAIYVVLYLVYLVDPPDENYWEVVTMVPYPYTPAVATCGEKTQPRKCELTPAEAALVNDLLNTEGRIHGLSDAIVTTTNRAATAYAARAFDAYNLQVAALADFRTRLSAKLARDARVRRDLAPLLLENRRTWLTEMSVELSNPALLAVLDDLAVEVLP